VRVVFLFGLALAGCSSETLPKQPEAPTEGSAIKQVGQDVEARSNKVAAAVTVVKENADKPHIVQAEAGVALGFLHAPSPGELAIARMRVTGNDPKSYQSAAEEGEKLVAKINSDLAKALSDQAEAKKVSDLKDARIAELERQLADSDGRLWTIAGIGLVVIGGLIWWFLKDAKGAMTIAGVGLMCGAYPRVMDSPWFMWIAIGSLAFCAGLGLWWCFDKVRDSIHSSDAKETPKE